MSRDYFSGATQAQRLRLSQLAQGKQPFNDAERRLVALAQVGDPEAWLFTSFNSQRYRALKTALNIIAHQDAQIVAPPAPAPVRVTWLARLLRPFKLAEA